MNIIFAVIFSGYYLDSKNLSWVYPFGFRIFCKGTTFVGYDQIF